MHKSRFIIIIFFTISVFTNAQIDVDFYLYKFDNEQINNFDIENNYSYMLRLNPAFINYQNIIDSLKFTNIIATDVFIHKTNGLYNFYEGDNTVGANLLAGGESNIKKAGTLFGFASYSAYKKHNVLLNYVSNPQDYLPYIIGDTIGKSDVNFKDYEINGGFGFNHNNWYYGLGFSYKGIVSSKLIDPRFSSYLSHLKFDIGLLAKIKNRLYSFRIFPEFNRQNISVKNFNQFSPMYFQFYGFGEWNKRESKAGYVYARLMTIKGIGFDFTYATVPKSEYSFNYLVNFTYKLNKVCTLEANNKNLFSSVNQYFTYNILLKKGYEKFDLYFLFKGTDKFQKGTEHIYENQKVNSEEHLSDYVKVASNQMYNKSLFLNSVKFKFIYRLTSKNVFHILLGINLFQSKEKYLFPYKQLLINNIEPFVGIAYNTLVRKTNLSLNIKISKQNNVNSSFGLPFVDNQIFINQAYIPYLIQSSENYSISSDLIYSYSLPSTNRLGFKVSVLFTNQTKQADYHYIINDNKCKLFCGNLTVFCIF